MNLCLETLWSPRYQIFAPNYILFTTRRYATYPKRMRPHRSAWTHNMLVCRHTEKRPSGAKAHRSKCSGLSAFTDMSAFGTVYIQYLYRLLRQCVLYCIVLSGQIVLFRIVLFAVMKSSSPFTSICPYHSVHGVLQCGPLRVCTATAPGPLYVMLQ